MIRVGILGATGTVGQRFLQLLERHPDFVVSAVAASDRSEEKPYVEACQWRLPGDFPESVRALRVRPCEPPLDCDVVFSSLPSAVARDVEGRLPVVIVNETTARRYWPGADPIGKHLANSRDRVQREVVGVAAEEVS